MKLYKRFNLKFYAILTCLLVLGSSAQAQMEAVNLINITAIKKMEVVQDGNEYKALVTLVFENDNERTIRLSGADFVVTIKSDKTTTSVDADGKIVTVKVPYDVRFGNGDIGELDIPASGSVEREIPVMVGPVNADSLTRIFEVFNIIGNPERKLEMNLKGEGDIGAEMDHGWALQRSIAIDFTFIPEVQDEVLVK